MMGGTNFLELIDAGASLVVGTVSDDGEPRAGRAWASRVIERDPLRIRLVMAVDDEVTVANVAPGAIVAVTGGDVRTLRSVQLKGCVRLVEPPTADDLALAAEHSAPLHGRRARRRRARRPRSCGGCCRTRWCASSWRSRTGSTRSPGPAAGRPWGDRR